MIPFDYLFYLAAFLVIIGLGVVIIKQNAIMMLIGIELMLNGVNLNLIAFNLIHPHQLHGHFFAAMIIVVAVCEAAVGLALVLRVYRFFDTSVPDDLSQLKG